MSHDDYYLPRLSDEYETEETVSIKPYCNKCGYYEEQADVLAVGNWYRWTAVWECPKCNNAHTQSGEWGE